MRSQRHRDEYRTDEAPEKPRSKAKDAFDVDLTDAQRDTFALWLAQEIDAAYIAREGIIGRNGEIDYYHFCYEQGRRAREENKWEGAADLASYIITEKADAMRARMVKTVFVEPVWTVDGWGEDAKKAPYAEEFHQWKLEDERLQSYVGKAFHNALIEGNGILEVIDRHDRRLRRQLKDLAPRLNEDGGLMLDDKNEPTIDTDEQGVPKPAVEGGPVVQASIDTYESVRKGPGYRIVSLRDFLYLPGHASDKDDLFGYAKRVYVRMGRLKEREKQGYYSHVKELDGSSERDSVTPSLERAGQQVADQRENTAEKELWEVLVLYDCDEDGIEEWYIATIHCPTKTLLRLKRDDLGIPRYMDFCPFPRTDSLYGYSYAGHKLLTLNEEHTALRNMIADRSTLATTPPLKRLQGALWEPTEQPWGTGRVIDVRSMEEIQPFIVQDVPASAIQREAAVVGAAERVSGQNDIATGASSGENRTLGERQMQAESSFVRVEEPVRNCQETMETLWLVRNELWIRTLEAQQDGVDAPESVVRNISTRGLELEDGKFTAAMLKGNLRGKPRGSVETADKARMRADFNGSITALAGMSKFNPIFAGMLSHPTVGKALLEQWARLYSVQDRNAFMQAADEVIQALKAKADAERQAQQQAEAMMGGMAPQGMLPQQAGPDGDPTAELMASLPPELAQMLQGGGQ